MVRKFWSSFVSEIIKISTLSLIREIRNSSLFLKEFIFKWAFISLLKFFRWKPFQAILVFFVLAAWFAFDFTTFLVWLRSSGRYNSNFYIIKNQLKIFDKNLHKVFCKIGAPLLFKSNLLPFRCWVFRVFKWSIKQIFFPCKVLINNHLLHLLFPWNDQLVL